MPFEESLQKYAHLLVTKAANIKPGQPLVINCPAERADFARLCVEEAYKAGASRVTVLFNDDQIARLTYLYEPVENFEKVPEWLAERQNSFGREKATFLHLVGDDPRAMEGVDPKKPAMRQRAANTQCFEYRKAVDFGHSAWVIGGVATTGWASVVFPELEPAEAVAKLWELIFETARVNTPDPVEAWEAHKKTFDHHKNYLNGKRFASLHYTNSLGTDLTIGLSPKSIWEGGGDTRVDGLYFFPNVPTEEVFTTPDRTKTEGVVYSSKPLVYAGNIIDKFWIKFEQGKAVDCGAEVGQETLESILNIDEGARYLGEAALVPKESPINQSGVLFYSTVYDENASCHIALGMGFPGCHEGGLEMSEDELLAAGVNRSATHEDFMIGTDDLKIVATTQDGEEVVLFENGTWAQGI